MDKKRFFKTFLVLVVTFIGMQLIIVAPPKAQETTEQNVTIKINEIVEDEYIKGKVGNIESQQHYKVLVYVHTDQWYIHPYANQDEGGSWAGIKEDGSWSIPTVKRQAKANKIAALVVDPAIAEDAPNKLENVEEIKNHTMIVYTKEEMKEKGWYGKL